MTYPSRLTIPEQYLSPGLAQQLAVGSGAGAAERPCLLYQLSAVVVHRGTGADEGHYVAYIRRNQDDSRAEVSFHDHFHSIFILMQ